MIKSTNTPSPDSHTVATIAKAGADAVEATKRLVHVTAVVGTGERSATAVVPYLFNADGSPVICERAMTDATVAYNKAFPDRACVYEMDDLASLLAWATRYKTDDTEAFVSAPTDHLDGTIYVVIDGLPKLGPDGGRGVLTAMVKLSLSDRLKGWLANNLTSMGVDAFSDFAARASEELSGAELLTMIANVEVRSESLWSRVVDADGKIRLKAEDTNQISKVPATFNFVVPVFDGDDEANGQTFTARLTTKISKDKKPLFTYEIVDFKSKLAAAVRTRFDAVATVVSNVYMGAK
jgi:uncharacterized protein YfdQ (DUF2303 family)